MKIPASQQESELAREAAEKTKKSLASSAESLKELLSILEENFIAIDKKQYLALSVENRAISASMWDLNVLLYKMREYEERIISLPEEQQG